jgi:cell division protease FtsH
MVDQEVKRILDEAYQRAQKVLGENGDLLETIAQALLERETLDRADVAALNCGDPLPPLRVEQQSGADPKTEETASPTPEKAPRAFGLPGGEGPLPGPAPGVVESGD